jgi:hypothetical protein
VVDLADAARKLRSCQVACEALGVRAGELEAHLSAALKEKAIALQAAQLASTKLVAKEVRALGF